MKSTLVAGVAVVSGCFISSLVLLTAQNAPRFNSIQLLTNKEVALSLSVSNGFNHRLDASSNLSAWAALVTLPGATSVIQHTDSVAPYFGQRFYRTEQLDSTNAFTGDHLATTNGEVIIHPIAHASFAMKWQGKMIYNDPTNNGVAYPNIPKADLILISHTHGDHFHAATIAAVTNANAIIIAPQAVYNSFSAALRILTIVLTNGVSTNVMGLNVQAIPMYNLTNSNHLPGAGNGYVLTIADKRIYASGDTADIPEMRALTNIDVAFVCMNEPFTMPVDRAASAVRAFQPKVVYPYHYRNGNGTLSDLNDFKKRVGQDLGIEVRLRKWY